MEKESMSWQDALKKLGIQKYEKRIFYSNSHGELLHLLDYIMIAEHMVDSLNEILGDEWFAEWFEMIVKQAEEKWRRPDSVFQHIPKLLDQTFSNIKTE